jgi:hypothetical protein
MPSETQGLQFADELADQTKEKFEGIGVGADYLSKATGDVAEVGGILLGISAQDDEKAGWEDVVEARNHLQHRLEEIGLDWEMNDELEQRQWEDSIFRRSPPYVEIVTSKVTDDHLDRL